MLAVLPSVAFRLAYIGVIVLATITEPGSESVVDWRAQLDRALTLDVTGTALVDVARNILLFFGWGVVWVLTSRPGPARPMLVRATLSGALLSALVEAAQLLDRGRVASVIDLTADTAGSLLGALGTVLLIVVARAGVGRRSYLGLPAVLLAGPYFAATFLESCFPIFRQTRLPGAWGSPAERLAQAFSEFGWASAVPHPLLEVLLFAPAGLLGVAALAELEVPRRRGLLAVLATAVALFAVAELVRGASGYPMSGRAFALHVTGVAAGALAAFRWLPAFSRRLRGERRARALLLAYAAVMALWVLRPLAFQFDPAALAGNLTSGHLVPLTAYRQRLDLFSTADVAIPAFLLLPVGGLLCSWPLRRTGWLATVLPALYLTAALEAGQMFVAGRMFDVTDILVSSAAAAVGWLVFRRAGYRTIGALLGAKASRSAGKF
jgi:VanZ family protein